LNKRELFDLLESRAAFYNRPSFIDPDPISIPHRFSKKEDIEIAGLLSATIAWGNRRSIVSNGRKMMKLMDDTPFEFVMNASPDNMRPLLSFVHRTFNGDDFLFFIHSLRQIYLFHGGLESLFSIMDHQGTAAAITNFRKVFLIQDHLGRTEKHVANPAKGSAAKRINMFLRWMIRNDHSGVDFGLWSGCHPRNLICPLDIHSGNTARKLGLLHRKQNDWKAACELTAALREFDPEDPVKYDFALFGMGITE
jgi:uncharacterized protein (TIGR02757 family)